MENIVLASTDPEFLQLAELVLPDNLKKTADVRKVVPGERFLDFLRYEIPDLVILRITGNDTNFTSMFQQLEEDPWLDTVGFIFVLDDVESQIELYQGFNISYFLNVWEVKRNLGRVVGILDERRSFLNYDSIIKKITSMSGEIVLESELLLVQYYSSLFSNYLFKEGYVDREKKYSVKLTLEELLTNAIEHGSAGITFDEKTVLQNAGGTVQDLVEERMKSPPWKGRKVTLNYNIHPLYSQFVITDEGAGFDVSQIPTQASDIALEHGRGIFLSMSSADEIVYTPPGNQVSVSFRHNGPAERNIPPGFIQTPPKVLQKNDVVFKENSTGDHIYYIVSGEFDVYVRGEIVARLTPADVFMGEMSFLLGNRRTATVVAVSNAKVVEISRQTFTDAVKRFPNYGIFLSKLLARRLRDRNLFHSS
ncbi:MAG: cyclic nucleotide-binding domain-containing protein [Spirochaetales bacterium]|nr:cyclic nucleotide-binding domain-containing protein [Spirochaetales bacterium]